MIPLLFFFIKTKRNFFLLLLALALLFVLSIPSESFEDISLQESQVILPSLTPTPTIVVGIPQTLTIPSIGINTAVEQVDVDSEGKMNVPQNAMNVGWYNGGAKPGEIGSAVFDGHYDNSTGEPAIFYNLAQLQPGDEVLVTDDLGGNYTFVVKELASYPYEEVPLEYIFNTKDKSRLNLITCDGPWDFASQNYLRRTVVYTELKE